MRTAPGFLIRRAQQVHVLLWQGRFQRALTGPQYGVLAALATEGPIDQRRLGELTGLDKNTASDVVRRLDQRGWLAGAADPADRRRRLWRLSEDAERELPGITEQAALVQSDLLGGLTAAQRPALVRLLRLLAFRGGPAPAVPAAEAPVLAFATTPGYLLRRSQQVHTALWADLVGRELTGPQYGVLVSLAERPGMDQVTLCSLAWLDQSSAADVVARLAGRALLHHRTQARDPRRSELELTAAGRRVLTRLTPKVRQVQEALLEPLTAAQGASLVSLLTRLG
ncbi:MarR family winged helix-turn-helix transcriptional regulator [Dactylosporangium sp. CA-092794]|uniref:MarR family winged helix-turn-helix transcriptional regulator n=1 Tax=Dactylosporangium sp. CA-092794 TaxID=3239929 RepID=UPI003D8F93C3